MADETRQKLTLSNRLREAEAKQESLEMEVIGLTEEIHTLQQKNGELNSSVRKCSEKFKHVLVGIKSFEWTRAWPNLVVEEVYAPRKMYPPLCNVEMDSQGGEAKSKWYLFRVDHDVRNKSERKRQRTWRVTSEQEESK